MTRKEVAIVRGFLKGNPHISDLFIRHVYNSYYDITFVDRGKLYKTHSIRVADVIEDDEEIPTYAVTEFKVDPSTGRYARIPTGKTEPVEDVFRMRDIKTAFKSKIQCGQMKRATLR